MEEELSLDNILDTEAIDDLFTDNEEENQVNDDNSKDEGLKDNKENNKENNNNTTENIDVDSLFTEGSESVGSGKETNQGKEDIPPKGNGSSPTIYSSIAKALKEDGVFPDLDEENLSKINNPEDFRDLIENQIKEGLSERQKRIDEALNYGIEPDDIKKYENTLSFLDSIKDDTINDESEKGEKLRKDLIYQDFINRGYSKDRAIREVKKSFDSGSDIEDAKEALKSNLEFFQDKYDNLINEAKKEAEKDEQDRKEQALKLKTSILEEKNVFGDLTIDKSTRQKIYDNIAKPIYKDPDSGEYYTALQKYQLENRTDFLKYMGLFYTLTDGFKTLDTLVKGKVNKEVKKGLKNLENTLNSTFRNPDGSLKYTSGVSEDPESFIEKGWELDV